MAKKESLYSEMFHFDYVMEKLKSEVQNNRLEMDEYDNITWLLKIVLESKYFFNSANELKIFLGNICGFVMDTKSTGRDRIIGWYFKRINEIENKNERQEIIRKIAKYTFASIPNNFKGWKSILEKESK